jgi:phosphoribosylanthranilate isomerase
METRVKICGITNPADALETVAAGADAIGLVFASGSSRRITPATAAAISQELPPFVARVGLFVNAPAQEIIAAIETAGLDTIQLHGDETPEFAAQFRRHVKVIRAFRVRGADTLKQLVAFEQVTDAWLLDAYVPGQHGGTGAQFDWDLAVQVGGEGRPVILAGGLNPANVAEAVRQVKPFAVDVSSGVESSPGRKDPEKVRAFVVAAKTALA